VYAANVVCTLWPILPTHLACRRPVPQLSLVSTGTPPFGNAAAFGSAFAFQRPPTANSGATLDAIIAAIAAGGAGGSSTFPATVGKEATTSAPVVSASLADRQQKAQQQEQQQQQGKGIQGLCLGDPPGSARGVGAPNAALASYRASREVKHQQSIAVALFS
jgi:hypothetical protein